ncbi:hypothetical protein [Marinoscillum pacificum]|uniref:hypothetical protein n=1 Tax=Marinoscillum pacificum TaxID=392723 RepID=UPI002157A789|nr:hypothetical protein [Marinoscillum pacificum]
MFELSFDYWNQLAGHLILTCALLTGFSIAITANLIINSNSNRLHNAILKVSTISSGCFLVAVFALTNILMKTTEGYPFEVTNADLTKPRIIGILSYMLGVVSLLTVIGMSGWTKSRNTGIFTTVVSAFALILIMFFI